MKAFGFIVLLCSAGLVLFAQDSPVSHNLGFEEVDFTTNLPIQWKNQSSGKFLLGIDSTAARQGRYAVVITSGDQPGKDDYGCISHTVDLSEFDVTEVEISGSMRLESGSNDNAQCGFLLTALFDDGSYTSLELSDQDLDIGYEWQRKMVKMPIAGNVRLLYIGVILKGEGSLVADDLNLLINGKSVDSLVSRSSEVRRFAKKTDFNKDLLSENVDELTKLCQVWGYLKYYHPKVRQGEFNWDLILLKSLYSLKGNGEASDPVKYLFGSIGLQPEAGEELCGSQQCHFFDSGVFRFQDNLSPATNSMLHQVFHAQRDSVGYYAVPLHSGIRIQNEPAYKDMRFPDVEMRLLSLFRYWNIVQYYYPYHDSFDKAWDLVLRAVIGDFINASSAIDYRLEVLKLATMLNDRHAVITVNDPLIFKNFGYNFSNAVTTYLENQVIVTDFYNPDFESNLKRGDTIIEVNDLHVDSVFSRIAPYTPASKTRTKKIDIARWNLLRGQDSTGSVTIKRNGEIQRLQEPYYSFKQLGVFSHSTEPDTSFRWMGDSVAYINPSALSQKAFADLKPSIIKSKGLILDYRSSPRVMLINPLGNLLMEKPVPFSVFSRVDLERPGIFRLNHRPNFVGAVTKEAYKHKIAILVSRETLSSGEYQSMAFKVHPNAVVVGCETMGANGNIAGFEVPGGVKVRISTVGVHYPDGKSTAGLGVVPDISACPTVESSLSGYDYQLDIALDAVQ